MFKIHAKMIFIILTNCREKMMKEKRFAFRVSRFAFRALWLRAQCAGLRAREVSSFEFS